MTEFDGVTRLNPLQSILPHATTGSLAVPVFDVAGRPALLLVLTSSEKRFRFVSVLSTVAHLRSLIPEVTQEPADRAFVQSVGGVFMASLLRQQATEAGQQRTTKDFIKSPVAHNSDPRSREVGVRLADFTRASHSAPWHKQCALISSRLTLYLSREIRSSRADSRVQLAFPAVQAQPIA